MKKINKKVVICGFMCVVLFFVVGLYILNYILCGKIPLIKKHYSSYDKFREVAASENFPNTILENAKNIKYYSYSLLGTEAYAIAFTVNSESFDSMKKEAENYYRAYVDEEVRMTKENNWNYTMVSDNHVEFDYGGKRYYNEIMNDDILDNNKYAFLKSLSTTDLREYEIVGYYRSGNNSKVVSDGVLASEENRQLIYFYHSYVNTVH